MQGCSSVLFFEARKKKDLYVWLAKAPEGPSVKFYVTNGVSLCFQHAYSRALVCAHEFCEKLECVLGDLVCCTGSARPWNRLPERTYHGTAVLCGVPAC